MAIRPSATLAASTAKLPLAMVLLISSTLPASNAGLAATADCKACNWLDLVAAVVPDVEGCSASFWAAELALAKALSVFSMPVLKLSKFVRIESRS